MQWKCRFCGEEYSIYGCGGICDDCFGEQYNKLIKKGLSGDEALNELWKEG